MVQKTEDLIDFFFADSDVQRLVTSTASWQPLRICYPKEVNVSRFIAWLLDPSEGHGLGDITIQSLLTRAWWGSDDVALSAAERRFISPSNIQSEGFSSAVVTTEVTLGNRSLDVLVVDASRKRYIAIENKFGASQAYRQLKDYRRDLIKLFPEFMGVHILLDSKEAKSADPAWITVGYDWLADHLREAEKREATAPHVREALSQFRSVIEEEAEESGATSVYGRLVTEVASRHPEVFNIMEPWVKNGSKGARAQTLAQLMKDNVTLEGKATLRLFQLYWRRTPVWDDCVRQAQFAPFVASLRNRFNDLLVDTKRVRTGFSLNRWSTLVDTDSSPAWYYPAGVNVRKTGEKFKVVTFVQFNDVRPDKRAEMIGRAEEMRKKNGVKRRVGDEQSFAVIRQRKELQKDKAIDETISELAKLKALLDAL
ncbi:PD-(D/E)XK nuclease family protein [Burkholderia contaminans]|uniref:PD-(D/E)XK nuclease superfamily protein n=2 Tax=Burkholderia contaminans TaxID=488447 RepID=A0A3N8RCC7_9BURK|nr:PD-(D/E)XK nuclease family protein [Burkholderia contaminans]RQT33461.1 hypothetical protein DF037_07710 [Burkholderia contaminans]